MLLAAAESVNLTDLPALWDAYRETILGWILNTGAAAAILIIGLWIAGGIRKFIRRRIEANPKIDPTLGGFIASIVYYLAVAFVVIAVLNRFGVQTTSLVAMLGAATLAVGLALQGTLGNVAAGVMVVLFRPYKLGDYVEVAGEEYGLRGRRTNTSRIALLTGLAREQGTTMLLVTHSPRVAEAADARIERRVGTDEHDVGGVLEQGETEEIFDVLAIDLLRPAPVLPAVSGLQIRQIIPE